VDEEPLRVLVDTNVWVSAVLSPEGPPARIVDALRRGCFVPVVADELLDEVRDVLGRPRIRRHRQITDGDVTELLALLRDRAVIAIPTGTLHVCRDPDDDYLVETAILGGARFAVSRDDDLKRDLDLTVRLRSQGIEVVSVAQFLSILDADSR
jgi:putative PIN family toxin of toxin-antitoxin system